MAKVCVCKIEDLFQHYVELLISHQNNIKIKLLTITHGHSPLQPLLNLYHKIKC